MTKHKLPDVYDWPTYESADERHTRAQKAFAKIAEEFTVSTDVLQTSAGKVIYIRARRPMGEYWFDVTATPTSLNITGDMGSYTYAHPSVREQLSLFNTSHVNPRYRNERLSASDRDQPWHDDFYREVAFEVLTDLHDELVDEEKETEEIHTRMREVAETLFDCPPETRYEAEEIISKLGEWCNIDESSEYWNSLRQASVTYGHLWCMEALRWVATRHYAEQAQAEQAAA